MTKEEVKNIIDFDGNNLKLKLHCLSKDIFKIQGKIVTFEEETKKFVEKYLKQKIENVSIIFV